MASKLATYSVLGITLLFVVSAFLVPVSEVEKTTQKEVDYEIVNQDTSLQTSINQLTGLGDTELKLEVRNLANVHGTFNVKADCETKSGNKITLMSDQYIKSGDTKELTLSTSDQLQEGTCSLDVNAPVKEVEVDKKVTLFEYLFD